MSLQAIDNIIQRKAAVLAALQAFFGGTRIVRGHFKHQQQQIESEMVTGVLMLVSAGESDYTNNFAIQAREGTLNLVLIGHLKADVAAGETAEQLENKEMTVIESIKQFCRTPLAGMSFELVRCDHSLQQTHPYGWVVCVINVLPPTHNLNK